MLADSSNTVLLWHVKGKCFLATGLKGKNVFLMEASADSGQPLGDDQGRSPSTHRVNPFLITANSVDI